MIFNTSTLGYKLLSGQLRKNRKHSEQLNKYLAGYIDGDGCFSIGFKKRQDGFYGVRVRCLVSSGFNIDCDGQLLRAFRDFYNLGSITIIEKKNPKHHPITVWELGCKDTQILFNRIGKHLRVKGTHAENLIWLYNNLKDIDLTKDHIKELREFSDCSRKNSKWLKHPKHPSWAWVAGMVDSDGSLQYSIRYRKDRKNPSNVLLIAVTAAEKDEHIINFLHKAFRGRVRHQEKLKAYTWERALGKQNEKFALPFLKKLRKYSCIPHKYTKINEMIKFHEDNKLQRLSAKHSKRVNDSPNN